MHVELSAAATLAERAARAGGRIIRAAATGPQQVSHKGVIDLVTEVDLASEATIRELLAKESPGVPVHDEEGGGAAEASTRWIVDPLDGTTNFVHGFPSYCVSIGLQDDGVLVAGCVYDPIRDEAYTAALGRGAFCEGQRLRV